jgi:hypothetical protein
MFVLSRALGTTQAVEPDVHEHDVGARRTGEANGIVPGAGLAHHLGRVRTRAFSAETILRRTGRHHFTGAMIGLYATGAGSRAKSPADFHWFDYAA